MHAWEAIQKTLNHIEDYIGDEIEMSELAEIAALSVFYYQRLFARLVKKPVREYIKLRRLARAYEILKNKDKRILDVAIEFGFSSHETFTRAFKDTYGITPMQYRDQPVGLEHFEKPNLLINYVMIDEGVPLISDGLVLEINRMTLNRPIHLLGVTGHVFFTQGIMLGERTRVSKPGEVWNRFQQIKESVPHVIPGRQIGMSYPGDAPEGFFTYFAGAEVEKVSEDERFVNFTIPVREYIVCGYEAEDEKLLHDNLGKAMKFTRFWLKSHHLRADPAVNFFPEIYFQDKSAAYMELWVPFVERGDKN